MGTDIHYEFQKKVKKEDKEVWETIAIDDEEYDSKHNIRRHYLLFSVLADVRNGVGFAGVPTYKPVVPISEPRGLPDDLERDEDGLDTTRFGYGFTEDEDDWRFGDHSFSHLSSDEILDYFKEDKTTTSVGIISKTEYLDWDRTSAPDGWCGGISGKDIKVFDTTVHGHPETLEDDISHVKILWETNVTTSINYFKEMIEELVGEHGPLRMVFGFDS